MPRSTAELRKENLVVASRREERGEEGRGGWGTEKRGSVGGIRQPPSLLLNRRALQKKKGGMGERSTFS